MGIDQEDIKKYIKGTGKNCGEKTFALAVRMPSVINMAVFGPMAALFDMRYNILNVSEDGMLLIAVDNAGRLRPEHYWFSKENIRETIVKKKLTHYEVFVETSGGLLRYRLNKTMIGSSFQSANVGNVIGKLREFG